LQSLKAVVLGECQPLKITKNHQLIDLEVANGPKVVTSKTEMNHLASRNLTKHNANK